MKRLCIVKGSVLIFLLTIHHFVVAQVNVKGGFIQDTARIGEPVQYYLTARYPRYTQVLFPDSTFRFTPFEFQKKIYTPTLTREGQSYDSAVYTLMTFEIDEVQYLSLPVFQLQAADCTYHVPIRDSIVLSLLVTEPVPDSISAQDLPLKTNTTYQRVPFLFNYPILVIILVSLGVLVIVLWMAFGKRIRKYFKLKRLTSNHQKFLHSFTEQIRQLQQQFNAELTERALSLWKKYLENLEGKPYTKLTTRETLHSETDTRLRESLPLLDKAIYGHHTTVVEPLSHLQRIAEEKFEKKVAEINHGKS